MSSACNLSEVQHKERTQGSFAEITNQRFSLKYQDIPIPISGDEGSSKTPKRLVFQRKSLVGDFRKRTLSDATQPDKLLQQRKDSLSNYSIIYWMQSSVIFQHTLKRDCCIYIVEGILCTYVYYVCVLVTCSAVYTCILILWFTCIFSTHALCL